MEEEIDLKNSAHDFDAVYREFRPKIRRYLRHLAGGALSAFRGESSLSTWIYRIATNVARDHARAAGKWDIAEIESVEDLPDPAREAAGRAYIRGVVEELPEQYRAVLLLSDVEELSNAEIAEILGLSLDTVKIRLHRARTRLRVALACRCTFYRDDGNELMCDRKTEE